MDTQARECLLTTWRKKVVDEAMAWKGTPFHHKGRIKGVGVDCGGFIYEVFKAATGLPHEAYPSYYAEDWALHKDDNEIYLSFLQPYVRLITKPGLGDLVMWKFGRAFSHGTIYIGKGEYIHAYGRTTTGCVTVSDANMFQIGMAGRRRESKIFTVQERWLS